MPGDIGPELRLARPRTHIGLVRARDRDVDREPTEFYHKRSHTSNGRRGHQEEDYNIELLEYEWPDLPPIIHMKDAVTRKRVSRGIDYILPVDKGMNSIDNRFRTDLRAMFQEPYATDNPGYDDNKITKSAKIHFLTNSVDTKWTRKDVEQIPVHLNSQSEKFRKLYAHSAPAGGRSKVGLNTDEMRTRSSLFLPIKATAHPESKRLRQEVDKIIKSVQEDNDDYDADKDAARDSDDDGKADDDGKGDTSARESDKPTITVLDNAKPVLPKSASETVIRPSHGKLKLTATKFDSYKQLKNTPPPKPTIPESFKSQYLSPERNQEIWEWLHHGEGLSDFQFFLSVCG